METADPDEEPSPALGVFKSLPLTGMETVLTTFNPLTFTSSFQIITPHGDGNFPSLRELEESESVFKSLPLTGMETAA